MVKTNAKRLNDSSMSLLVNDGISIARRSIDLFGDIDEAAAERLVRGVYLLLEKDPIAPINIHICSDGGDAYVGFFLYDFIRSLEEVEVITHACGKVFSAAAIIFMAGDIRKAHENSVIMFHSVSTAVRGKAHEILSDSRETDALVKQMCEILSDHTIYDSRKWEKMIRYEDLYLRNDQALEYGILTPEAKDE